MTRPLFALGMALALMQPAFAADMSVFPRHHRNAFTQESHVVEVVIPPFSGTFVTNGFLYAGTGAACRQWTPGERIRLISGSWHGDCAAATFYNLSLRTTCETLCRGAAFYR